MDNPNKPEKPKSRRQQIRQKIKNNEPITQSEQNYLKPLTAEQGKLRRQKQFEKIDKQHLKSVVKYMIEQLPELNLQAPKVMQYLRLLYIGNPFHINALDKICSGVDLNHKDIIPESIGSIVSVEPVYTPDISKIDQFETDQQASLKLGISVKQVLTPMENRFIENIKNGMHEKQAMEQAGYSPSAVKIALPIITSASYRPLLTNLYRKYRLVWKEYHKAIQERMGAAGITEDYVLSKLKSAADFNPKLVFDKNNNFKNIHDLDDNIAQMITEIKISETKTTYNKSKQTTTKTKTMNIKFNSKESALKELAKLQQGIFEHTRQKTVNHNMNVSGKISHGHVHTQIDVNTMSESEINKILMIDQQKKNNELLSLSEDDIDNDIIDAEII